MFLAEISDTIINFIFLLDFLKLLIIYIFFCCSSDPLFFRCSIINFISLLDFKVINNNFLFIYRCSDPRHGCAHPAPGHQQRWQDIGRHHQQGDKKTEKISFLVFVFLYRFKIYYGEKLNIEDIGSHHQQVDKILVFVLPT